MKLNIAITAGGTSEPIDGVRKMTNVSTGRLGWQCLEAVLDKHSLGTDSFKVYYIHTDTAFRGELTSEQLSHVQFVPVTDAASVYEAVDHLTRGVSLTHFVHAMAISDFTFSYAVSPRSLAQELHQLIVDNPTVSVEQLQQLLEQPESSLAQGAKISSKEPLLIGMKTTHKVISLIKKNNPDTLLVGFKLLRNVGEAELMQEAARLTAQNGCDMVFANELSTIGGSGHTGLLIRDGEVIARPEGKDKIAAMIIDKMLSI